MDQDSRLKIDGKGSLLSITWIDKTLHDEHQNAPIDYIATSYKLVSMIITLDEIFKIILLEKWHLSWRSTIVKVPPTELK